MRDRARDSGPGPGSRGSLGTARSAPSWRLSTAVAIARQLPSSCRTRILAVWGRRAYFPGLIITWESTAPAAPYGEDASASGGRDRARHPSVHVLRSKADTGRPSISAEGARQSALEHSGALVRRRVRRSTSGVLVVRREAAGGAREHSASARSFTHASQTGCSRAAGRTFQGS